mmetsp:Transcript_10407/g.63536  ORF Transcript_10407/g.63536 Transcript_10407/m.63536 type:complete len:218 (+) Transcript_10407:10181-10834(+)
MSTVTNTVGMVAASSNVKPKGMGARLSRQATLCVPKQPEESPNTDSPTEWKPPPEERTHAQSPPGGPGSPGYMPKTFSTSRKFKPTAITRTRKEPTGGEAKGTGRRLPKEPRGTGNKRNSSRELWAELGRRPASNKEPDRTRVPYRLEPEVRPDKGPAELLWESRPVPSTDRNISWLAPRERPQMEHPNTPEDKPSVAPQMLEESKAPVPEKVTRPT